MSEEKKKPLTTASREASKRSGINEKEQEVLNFWNEHQIFEKSITSPASGDPKGDFSFYDGPPFATGLPHFGHILAGTIKDAIPRYQTMNGKSVRRKWGWDCHGLPIENLIEKEFGLKSKQDIEDFGIGKFNKEASDSVLRYDREWKEIIPRLGRFVDMENDYKTMDANYTESIWWAWKSLYEKGLAYEGHKMMHICPRCETTLAQSEVGMNYEDVTDISVTVKFELKDEPGTYVLAWTTTPWTLPGNTALAIKKDAEYIKVKIEGEEGLYILAKDLAEAFLKDKNYEIVDTFLGEKLLGKKYVPPFNYFKDVDIENKENIWKIWHADFITLDTGTGIAHEAPAFGEDDMNLAKANNIPVIKHIKMDGTFVKEVTDFAGMKVKVVGDTQSADIEVLKWLAHNGKLFEKHKIIHSYPLCWRCKTPLLNYATSSWFVDVPKIKPRLLEENQKIGWTPEHIRDGRFGKWLEGAREWAVSRTRYWGAPLPVWKCEDCEQIKIVGSLKELADGRKSKNNYFVVRHGQAQSNLKKTLECKGDPANTLTDNGRAEILLSAQNLKKESTIDLIISSEFVRAKESAEIFAKEFGGVEIIIDKRLNETNLGIYDGRTVEDYLKENGRLDFLKYNHRPEGGETHGEVLNRVMACLFEQEKKYEGKNILFVSHGGPVRMMMAGAELATEEEVISDENKEHVLLYIKNGEVHNLDVKIVPRDETGAINLHRPHIDNFTFKCECGKEMKRIPDVFDCWFESGSMPFAQIHYPFENKKIFDKNYPADFIAEGLDQTRGWFYSLINLGVALFDKAPYKHVIVNGMVLADSGLKLSKSERNYTDPMEIVEKYGADALRYFLLSSPLMKGESVQFRDEYIDEVYKKVVMRLENVLSLYEMNKIEADDKYIGKTVLDEWIISRLNEVIKCSTKGYEGYCLDEATRPIEQFVDDLSVWYVRRSRDRLKGDNGEEEQKKSYATLAFVLCEFSKVIAPVMPFIAERIYKTADGKKESVHLESWSKDGEVKADIVKDMKEVRDIVSQALMKRTESKIGVRQPLAKLFIDKELREEYKKIIAEEINVKEIVKGDDISLDINLTPELIKEGELRNLMREIQDKRKESGLSPKDLISLKIGVNENYFGKDFNEQLKSVCKIKELSFEDKERDEKIYFEIIK